MGRGNTVMPTTTTVSGTPITTSSVVQWQRTLWWVLLGWWVVGVVVCWLWQPQYQLPWLFGCMLGASQGALLHGFGYYLHKRLQRTNFNVIPGLFALLLLSFVKMILVAYLIVALSAGNTANLGVEMLGFLGYNCCIVFVSAFCFRSVITVDNGI
jgi:hypothetical protein